MVPFILLAWLLLAPFDTAAQTIRFPGQSKVERTAEDDQRLISARQDLLGQNARYAVGVVSQSSSFNGGSFGVIGAPDHFPLTNVISSDVWTSQSAAARVGMLGSINREWIELQFGDIRPVGAVYLFEIGSPGAVDTVYARNAETGAWTAVWTGMAAGGSSTPVAEITEIRLSQPTAYPVDMIRLAIDQPAVSGAYALDAVALTEQPISDMSVPHLVKGSLQISRGLVDPSSGPPFVNLNFALDDDYSRIGSATVSLEETSSSTTLPDVTLSSSNGREFSGLVNLPPGTPEGIYEIIIEAQDGSGNNAVIRTGQTVAVSSSNDNTAPTLVSGSTSLNGSQVNIGHGGGTVTASVQLDDNLSGVRSVNFYFQDSAGNRMPGTVPPVFRPTSGTSTSAGEYRTDIPIPPGTAPGTWTLWVSAGDYDENGRQIDTGVTLDVVSQTDNTAPAVNPTAVTVSPTTLSLDGGTQVVTFEVPAEDASSGVKSVNIGIGPQGTIPARHTGGSAYDGTWMHMLEVPPNAPPGTYPVNITVADSAGNSQSVPMATPITINPPAGDVLPPEIPNGGSLTLSTTNVDLDGGAQTLDISVPMQDAGTGVAGVEMFVVHNSIGAFRQLGPVSGTLTGGKWAGTVAIPEITADGTWSVYLTAADQAGNMQTISTGRTLTISGGPDRNPPYVSPFAGPATVTPSTVYVLYASETVSVSVPQASIEDDDSGVASVELYFKNSVGDSTDTAALAPLMEGSYAADITIPAGSGNGPWELWARATDQVGNTALLDVNGTLSFDTTTDDDPPSATGSPSLSKAEVYVEDGPTEVTAELSVTDNRSGVTSVEFFFEDASGNAVGVFAAAANSSALTWDAPLTIPQGTPDGTWRLMAHVEDAAGNRDTIDSGLTLQVHGQDDRTLVSYNTEVDGTVAEQETVRYKFEGTAGDTTNVAFEAISLDRDSGSHYLMLRLIDPTGNLVTRRYGRNFGDLGVRELQHTGTYTVEVVSTDYHEGDGVYSHGSYRLAVSTIGPPQPLSAPAQVSGDIPVVGQHQYYAFDGSSGDEMEIILQTNNTSQYLYLRKPGSAPFYNQSQEKSFSVPWYGDSRETTGLFNLAETGTYIVEVRQFDDNDDQQFTLNVTTAGVAQLAFDSTVDSTLAPGTTHRYSFDGSAGQVVNLRFSGFNGDLELFAPDDDELYSWPLELPDDGTYTVELTGRDVSDGGPYDLSLAEFNVSGDLGAVTTEGVDQEVPFDLPGDRQYYAFEGSGGDVFNLLTNWSDGEVRTEYRVIRSTGEEPVHDREALKEITWRFYPSESGPFVLPADGTYYIEAVPFEQEIDRSDESQGPLSFTLTKSSPTQISDYGQTVQAAFTADTSFHVYSFSATADDLVSLRILNNDVFLLDYALYGIDGQQILSGESRVSFGRSTLVNTDPQVLPVTGTYTVVIEMRSGDPGHSYELEVLKQEGGPTAITSTAPYRELSGTLDGAGERDYYTFAADSGDVVAVELGIPEGSSLGAEFELRSQEPDYVTGTRLSWGSAGSGASLLRYAELSSDGDYTIEVLGDPSEGEETGAYTFRFNRVAPADRIVVGTDLSLTPDAVTGFPAAALRAVNPGGTVEIGDGTYPIQQYAPVGAGVTVEGAGPQATTLQWLGDDYLRVEQNTVVRNLTLERVEAHPDPMVDLRRNATGVTVENVRFVGTSSGIGGSADTHDFTGSLLSFELEAAYGDPYLGIGLTGDRIQIEDSEFHGIDGRNLAHAIALEGDDALVRNATFHAASDGSSGIAEPIEIKGNRARVMGNLFHTYDTGVNIRGSSGQPVDTTTVADNEFRGQNGNQPVSLYEVTSGRVSNNLVLDDPGLDAGVWLYESGGHIFNNRITTRSNYGIYYQVSDASPPPAYIYNNSVRSSTYGLWVRSTAAAQAPVYVHNNIFVRSTPGGGAGIESDVPLAAADYNLIYNFDERYGDAAVAGAHDLYADPLFVDDTFALQDASPAIDAGTNDHMPAADAVGTERPQGTFVDIGAVESTSGASVQLPGELTYVSPDDSAIVAVSGLVLDWQQAEYAQTYDVYVWKAGTTRPATPVAADRPRAEVRYEVSGDVQSGTAYSWQIVARNAGGQTEGPVRTFFARTEVTLAFQVDMRRLERLEIFAQEEMDLYVEIFDGPRSGRYELTDSDQDTVWTADVPQLSATDITYAFAIDPNPNVDSYPLIHEETGAGRRTLTVPTQSMVLGSPWFGNEAPGRSAARAAALQVLRKKAGGSEKVVHERGLMHGTLDIDRTPANALVAVHRYAGDPGGAPPSTISTVSSQGYWTIETIPGDVQLSADIRIDYAPFTGITVPEDLRLLRRGSSGELWETLVTVVDTEPSELRAAGISQLRGQWTIGTTTVDNPLVGRPPGSLSYTGPADGAVRSITNVSLDWERVRDAGTYDVYVWEENAPRPNTPLLEDLAPTTTEVSIDSDQLTADQTYSWQIVAANIYGVQEGSVRTFTTSDTAPVTFQVDMNRMIQDGLFDPVGNWKARAHVFTGSIQEAVELADDDGDGIYTGTVDLVVGEQVSYAYVLDRDGRGRESRFVYELDGTSGGRQLTVAGTAQTIPVASFDNRQAVPSAPTPAAEVGHSFASGDTDEVEFTDPNGGNTYVTINMAAVDRPANVAVQRFDKAPTGSPPSGIDVISSQGYWKIAVTPAAAAFSADLIIHYDAYNGIADADDLRLLRRSDDGSDWQVVSVSPDKINGTLSVRNLSSFSEWTLGSTSTVNALEPGPPGSFTHLTPADGEAVDPTDAELQWESALDAETYDLYIWPSGQQRPASPTVADIDGARTSAEVSTHLDADQTYSWQVAARNAEGTTESTTTSLLTRKLPDLVISDVQVPASASRSGTITVEYTVENVGEAATGESAWQDYIWISRDDVFASPPVFDWVSDSRGWAEGDQLLGAFPNVTALGPGESYTATQTVEMPDNPNIWSRYLGDRFLFVQTDNMTSLIGDTGLESETDPGAVGEEDEENNTDGQPITITRPDPADLEVTDFVAPSNLFSGEKFEVKYRVTNREEMNETQVDHWVDHVYLSEDDQYGNDDDVFLGEYTHEDILEPGDQYEVGYMGGGSSVGQPGGAAGSGGSIGGSITYNQLEVILPRDFYGSAHLFVVVDADKEVYEGGSLTNNRAMESVSVTLKPPPDLETLFLEVRGQDPNASSVDSNDSLYVAYRTKNNGPGPLVGARWATRFYLADEPTLDGSSKQIFLGSTSTYIKTDRNFSGGGSVVGGGSAVYTTLAQRVDELFELPRGLAGDFYVIARVDANDNIYEHANETNNTAVSEQISISVGPSPDLTVESVDVQSETGGTISTVTGGDLLEVTYRVANKGDAPADQSFTDGLYLTQQTDQFDREEAIFLRGVTQDEYVGSAGQSNDVYEKTAYIRVPNDRDGQYYVAVQTNIHNGVYEHDNAHSNSRRSNQPVTIESRELDVSSYDIAIEDILVTTPPDEIKAGEEIAVEWTLQNSGTDAVPAGRAWHVSVLLSTDREYRSTDTELDAYRVTGMLGAESSLSRETRAEIPEHMRGPHYVIVRVSLGGKTRVTERSIEIEPAALPNIYVSDLTVVENDLRSGQPMTVRYTVENNGEAAAGIEGRTDVVYLSDDLRIDWKEDVKLVVYERTEPLEPGASGVVEVSGDIPVSFSTGRYYALVHANPSGFGSRFYEETDGDNIDRLPVDITLPEPVNLAVTSVSVPEDARPGEKVTVDYTLTNGGSRPFSGVVDDAVYFSTDEAFQIDDPLMGLNRHEVNLAPNGSAKMSMQVDVAKVYTMEALTRGASGEDSGTQRAGKSGASSSGGTSYEAVLPGLAPGDYRAIVRVNSRRTVRETNYENNLKVSSASSTVTIDEIDIGTTKTVGLQPDERRYLQYEATGGRDLNVTLNAPAGQNEIYVAKDRLPTRADYDWQSPFHSGSEPRLVIPSTEEGTYYLLFYGHDLPPGGTQGTANLEELDFAVTGTHTNRIGDLGTVTLGIRGSQFKEGAAVSLQQGGVELFADEVELENSTLMKATFTMGQASSREVETSEETVTQTQTETVPLGQWTLRVTNPGGRAAVLPVPITVEPRLSPTLSMSVDVPSSIATNQPTPGELRIFNPSNVDVEKAFVWVKMPEAASMEIQTLLVQLGVDEWDHEKFSWVSDGTRYVSIVIQNLPARTAKTLDISLLAEAAGDYEFETDALVLNDDEYVVALYLLLRQFTSNAGVPLEFGDPTEDLPSPGAAGGKRLARRASTEGRFARERVGKLFQGNNGCEGSPEERAARDLNNLADKYEDAMGGLTDLAGGNPSAGEEYGQLGVDAAADATTGLATRHLSGPAAKAADAAGAAGDAASLWQFGDDLEDTYNNDISDFFKENRRLRENGLGNCEEEPPGGGGGGGSGGGGSGSGGGGISPPNGGGGSGGGSTRAYNSVDPNDILGPEGYGEENWIAGGQRLGYTIRFENDPVRATAPARRVEIRQKLDGDLALGSFRLGDVQFGDHTVDVPRGRSYYQDRIDVRDDLGVYVDITAGVDVTSGEIFWIFESIDPATGQPSISPFKGFLPVNDSTHVGEGSVQYSLLPGEEASTGTRIDAEARIVFDKNAPIDTPPIFNTIDAGVPSSSLKPLDRSADRDEIIVKWTGTDDEGTGIATYDLYAAADDEPFKLVEKAIEGESTFFAGEEGHSYGFYVRARDHAGNVEPDKSAAGGTIVLGSATRVYSGDTNNDGTVDQQDVLPLGWHFGRQGPMRAERLIEWISGGYVVTPWKQADGGGENPAYADANGDGEINEKDLLAIGVNFGRGITGTGKRAVGEAIASVEIPPLPVGTEVPIRLRLGSEDLPVANVLGTAGVVGVSQPGILELEEARPSQLLDDGRLLSFKKSPSDGSQVSIAYTRRRTAATVGEFSGESAVELTFTVVEPMAEAVQFTLHDADVVGSAGVLGSSGLSLSSPRAVARPEDYRLAANYPNPFNPQTTIRFALPEPGRVTIEVYNAVGRRVAVLKREEQLDIGWHTVHFDGLHLASGVYFYRLQVADGAFQQVRKMMLVK